MEPSRKITGLAEFCAEGERLGLTAFDLAEALKDRPEFADCLPSGVRASAAPLSEERLHELATAAGFGFFGQWQLYQGARAELVAFARAIEAAHGVTDTPA